MDILIKLYKDRWHLKVPEHWIFYSASYCGQQEINAEFDLFIYL